MVVVVVVGLEVQTGDNGWRSLGGAKLCCIRPFGIACRNSVDGVESGEERRIVTLTGGGTGSAVWLFSALNRTWFSVQIT